ncbi:hypothetical protein C8R47DRAFT_1226622 [Mycena vitilis]|nr:hypothetical protein C8R47DRAFT_1226622 [Mycena vitilis]
MISDSGMQLTESDGGSASDVLSDSNDAEFTSGSGMFSGSQNLVVMATTLTNITNNSSATALRGPSGIRMFAFEDIDLLREIPLENGVAIFNQRGCVRRLHSSNVSGRQGAVAAAVYQGNDAYKEWKQDIARYRSVGHPNIVQIFGAATSGTIYATLFNDVAHFMDLYRHSPILTVYIYGYCSTQLEVWTFTSHDSSSEVLDATVILESFSSYQLPHQWLSQANHTFDRLDITSNLEEITIVDGVEFSLSVSAPTSDPPNGFLFLCPAKQFQAGPFAFTWPECAAYWSLDSSGVERLSTEDANSLGFPSIEFSTRILGKSWPANVYSGLRQFHRAKGFNPNGQDVSA